MIENLEVRDEDGKQIFVVNKNHLLALRDILLESYPDETMKQKEKTIATLKSENKRLRRELELLTKEDPRGKLIVEFSKNGEVSVPK